MKKSSTKQERPEKHGHAHGRLTGDEKTGKNLAGKSPGVGFFTIEEAAAAFSPEFFDEKLCREWVIEQLHPSGPRCPECGLVVDDPATLRNFREGRRCVCGRCGRKFTATSNTFLAGAQLNFRQILLMAYLADLLGESLGTGRIAQAVGVSPDTVRIWIKRFKAFKLSMKR